MNKVLCAVLPLVVAQQPTLLYNGGTPETANCAVKTSACDCHYASCTLAGVCACGWDDASKTCKAGIPTKCVSCPAMRHCSVAEKLKIGPDGFPVKGQLSVWGNVEYPDHSGVMAVEGSATQATQATATQPVPQPVQIVTQPVPLPVAQPQPTQVFGQSTASQAAPLSLYQNNPLSAGGCALKTDPCSCHYASCTPTGDCICGWDTRTQTCRAGASTACASCPSMHRCGVNEPLLIGPDGFPVPGQLSVWGQVPYPDEPASAPSAAPATQPTAAAGKGKGKAGKAKAGKKGKAGKNSTNTTGTQ